MKEEELNVEQNELLENGFEHFRIKVDPGQEPLRIDKFLINKMERISRNRLQSGIKDGCVFVNDKVVKSNFKVKPNQEIKIMLPKEREKFEAIPQDIPIDIVHEDNHIIILNKKPGMVVHPGHGNRDGTLVNALLYHLQKQELPVMEGNPMDRPGIVHRIDKETSGLLVIAKTKEAMTHLAKQFFDHSIERSYQAIVWGEPAEPEGMIVGHIGRNPHNRLQMTVFEDGSEGKEAITHYKLLEGLYYVSLVECKLETGRTHQIRVHFKHKGNPVFNDRRYGGDKIMKGTVFSKYKSFVQNNFTIIPRQALHAKTLGFIHPGTGKKVVFDSPLPDDMEQVLERWRNYVSNLKD